MVDCWVWMSQIEDEEARMGLEDLPNGVIKEIKMSTARKSAAVEEATWIGIDCGSDRPIDCECLPCSKIDATKRNALNSVEISAGKEAPSIREPVNHHDNERKSNNSKWEWVEETVLASTRNKERTSLWEANQNRTQTTAIRSKAKPHA